MSDPLLRPGAAPMLTIALPTYNRLECLLATLGRLLPQLTTECQLVIVDNASEIPVADGIRLLLAQFPSLTVRIVRNTLNIGANANILRCVELANTKWLWILSDDDRIWDDAVTTILRGIEQNPACTCINFAQLSRPRSQDSSVTGRTELLRVLTVHFATLLFLSTSVYRVEAILPSVTYGYMQIPSCAPHLAMLIMSVGDNGKVRFSARTIVEYMGAQPGSGWSQFWVERGFPLLLDLPLSASDRAILRKALASRLELRGILTAYIDVTCYGLRSQDPAVAGQLFDMFALRRATVISSPIEWCAIRCLKMTFIAPWLALHGIRAFYGAGKGRTLEERAALVGLSMDERV